MKNTYFYLGTNDIAKETIVARAKASGVKIYKTYIRNIEIVRADKLPSGLYELDITFNYKDKKYMVESHVDGEPSASAKFNYITKIVE